MNLRRELENRLSEALRRAGAPQDSPAMVARAGKAEFGDYQANGVMAAAKRMKINPRTLAERVVAAADVADLAEPLEIAGPGFVNIRLKGQALAGQVSAMLGGERLGIAPPVHKQNVVVDFSGPNLAKEMHVGHLRSTIIGDALARTLEFVGHNVIRQNHVGDWGTQFGMLIAYMDSIGAGPGHEDAAPRALADLEEFYRQAKRQFDGDAAFAAKAREYVVRLQRGEEHCLRQWQAYIEESLRHCDAVYRRLGVSLGREHLKPESSYNDDLPGLVADLDRAGLLSQSQGAKCVFLPQFTGKDDQPLPLIVQKSDEGFLYASTDLAAIRYRSSSLRADRILYVVDARQSLHFKQVFAVARAAGFAPPGVTMEHIGFGTMLGADGKPFKTRAGGTPKLMDLLDEAVDKALDLVERKNPDLPEDQKRLVAEAVGIGAVKYADLSQNRNSDYVFSYEKMLSLEGNTAPYMQYAYARIRSIFRKGADRGHVSEERLKELAGGGGVVIAEAPERALALALNQFAEAVETVATECLPNVLCAYLYDLAGAFMGFYESCPVLQADEPQRASRLCLCLLTAQTIQTALDLLGIRTIEQM